jgi:hypothetical protein
MVTISAPTNEKMTVTIPVNMARYSLGANPP